MSDQGGFEVLRRVRQANDKAEAEELRRAAEQEPREGIDAELWRALQ